MVSTIKCFKCKNNFIDNEINLVDTTKKYLYCNNCINYISFDNKKCNDREMSIEIGSVIIDMLSDNNLLSDLNDITYILIFDTYYIDNNYNICDDLKDDYKLYYLNKLVI